MLSRSDFQPLIVNEICNISFDFTNRLGASEVLLSAVIVVGLASGTDPDPSDLLNGSPTVSSDGKSITQSVAPTLSGNIYNLTCLATSDANQFPKQQGYLAILPQ